MGTGAVPRRFPVGVPGGVLIVGSAIPLANGADVDERELGDPRKMISSSGFTKSKLNTPESVGDGSGGSMLTEEA